MDNDNKTIVILGVITGVVLLVLIVAIMVGNMYGPYGGETCERACGSGRVAECGKTIRCVELGK
jgi:hypothetical protein